MRNFCFIFVLIIINWACTKERTNFRYTIQELGLYEIKLDNVTSPVEDFVQYLPNWKGKESYAFHIRSLNQIKIYDLNSGELFDSINYSARFDQFKGIYDFHIVNEDSIFLNKRYMYKTYLINNHLKIIKELNFLNDSIPIDEKTKVPLSSDTFLPVFSHNRLFKLIDKEVYLTGSPDRNARFADYFNSFSLLVKYDLNSDNFSPVLGYQDKMKDKAWGPLHSRVYSDYNEKVNKFFVSYEGDENLYIFDKDFKESKSIYTMPEGDFSRIKPLPINAIDNENTYLNHFNNQIQFGSVLFDQYRNLVYRVVHLPNPNYGNFFVKDPLYKPRDMVILVFDIFSLKKIAEIKLNQSENRIFLDRCFVDKEGFNISFINLNNENLLFFQKFNVIKNA